ncbi:MAG: hypothetical protein Kow0069_14960 [Promethearchaeota archaeon]
MNAKATLGAVHVPLDGQWTLVNEERGVRVPVVVPGSTWEALVEAGLLPDPFLGLNEREAAWVHELDWTWSREFDLAGHEGLLEHDRVELVFHGLDTVAAVVFNGVVLGHVDNAFRTWRFDVKGLLRPAGNELVVRFSSPTRVARERSGATGWRLDTGYAALPGVPHLRKPQYSFGWDWGPQLPDVGVWKPVELVAWSGLRIASVTTGQRLEYSLDPKKITDPADYERLRVTRAHVEVLVELERAGEEAAAEGWVVRVALRRGQFEASRSAEVEVLNDGCTRAAAGFTVEDPDAWYPHDLGEPALYDLEATLLHHGRAVDSKTIRVGLREVSLVRRPDEWGETFYFQVNGLPLFAKGANWIPVDSFVPRGKRLGLYRRLLGDARAANFNFLRVWGGGLYEDDDFYDACDELGILVWQDFPFACAAYPPTDQFMQQVLVEAEQNVKRLRHHPSLALWCGNNEIEWMWIFYTRKILRRGARKAFKRGYVRLFEEALPRLLAELDPQRPYWPSSPSNGGFSDPRAKAGLLRSSSPNAGDAHYWMVWHGGRPLTAYRKFDGRFMSEFGFESFPPLRTIRQYCPPDQMDAYSPVMEAHQKNRSGNKKIEAYMRKRFRVPAEFEKQVVLSQITHGDAMEYGVEHWRRNRNRQRCMGALFWQFNDCWPVASWSSIDYYGRWKALHYFSQRFYAPTFACVLESLKHRTLEVRVVNDRPRRVDCTVSWRVLDAQGAELVEGRRNVAALPCSSVKVERLDLSDVLPGKAACRRAVAFHRLDLSPPPGGFPGAGLEKALDPDGGLVLRGARLFDHPKHFPLVDPELSLKSCCLLDREGPPTYELIVRSEGVALYVHLDSEDRDLVFSDNFFAMAPGEERVLWARARTPGGESGGAAPASKLLEGLRVASLFDLTGGQAS